MNVLKDKTRRKQAFNVKCVVTVKPFHKCFCFNWSFDLLHDITRSLWSFSLLLEAKFLINNLNYCLVCFQVPSKRSAGFRVKLIHNFGQCENIYLVKAGQTFLIIFFGHSSLWSTTMITALSLQHSIFPQSQSLLWLLKVIYRPHKHTAHLGLCLDSTVIILLNIPVSMFLSAHVAVWYASN